MPEVPDSAACETYTNVHQHPAGNRRHDLLGANRFMMQMLAEDAAPGFESAAFDLAITQLDEFTKTAATVEVTAPDAVDLADGLSDLQVTVTNETGHKLPSGYSEGRVMWLEVVARYGDEVVASSGLWDQEAGTIQDDAQVRRYEGIAERLSDGTRNHLLLNDFWRSDNRIPPRGLSADIETDPVGDRYAKQPDGAWAHWDEVTYAFEGTPEIPDATPGDGADDELAVSVRLLYLINTPDYIRQLADDNETTEVGTELVGRFEAMGGATPVVFAEQELSIPISGFGSGADTGSTTEQPPTTGPGATTDTPGETTTPTPGDDSSGEGTDPGIDDDGGGCGCTAGDSGPAPWAWSLLLLGLVRRRRRS